MKALTKLISFFKSRKKAIITEVPRLSFQTLDYSVDDLNDYCGNVNAKYKVEDLIRKFNLIYTKTEKDLDSDFKTMYYPILLKISRRNK